MPFFELIKDYILEHKSIFFSYLLSCCLGYFIRVIVLSLVYAKFFDEKNNYNDFLKIITYICIIWFFLIILFMIQIRLEYKVKPDFLSYVRRRMFKTYIIANETNFDDSNITNDVNNILEITRLLRDLLIWSSQTLIPTLFIMICISAIFLFKYPLIGIINIIGNIITFTLALTSYEKLIKSSNERLDKYILMANKLDESLNNMFNVYINDKIEDTINDNNKIEEEYNKSFVKEMKDIEMLSGKIRINNYFFSFISLVMLYKKYLKSDFINSLFIYTFYLSSLEKMADDTTYIVIIIGNILRLYNNFAINNNNTNGNITKMSVRQTYKTKLENFNGDIKFENIWFRYKKKLKKDDNNNDYEKEEETKEETKEQNDDEKQPYVLQNFNLHIPAKSKIAIISRSGSGKSTLMKLLLNFYSPEKGQILLDDINLKDIDPVSVRKQINYINQRTLLIKDTIINNIKYGNNATDEDIINILNKYGLLKVFNPPDIEPESCLQKIVEKNGINMSMGMQKVIFLVRGILKDSKVFIFDEPLTSIDPNSREGVLNMINDRTQDKTLIIITHDMEITTIVDKVIDFKDINKNN